MPETDINARVCVLEDGARRFEKDIEELQTGMTDIKVCIAALPDVKKAQEQILGKVDMLSKSGTVLTTKIAIAAGVVVVAVSAICTAAAMWIFGNI